MEGYRGQWMSDRAKKCGQVVSRWGEKIGSKRSEGLDVGDMIMR